MIRRSTANFLVTLPNRRVVHRLRVLAARSDVLALQEWPRRRASLIRDLRRVWAFRRPAIGGGPIGIRKSLGEKILTCHSVVLAGPGYVGRIAGRRSVLGPSYATRLKTRRPDGRVVIRYNIHLTASVQTGTSGYRTDAAHAARVARHRRERDRLESRVARDLSRGFIVEVYGDTNFHHMPIPGLVGWWSVEPHEGTLGNRAIDGIWTSEPPESVDFLPELVQGEHRHVTATWL